MTKPYKYLHCTHYVMERSISAARISYGMSYVQKYVSLVINKDNVHHFYPMHSLLRNGVRYMNYCCITSPLT